MISVDGANVTLEDLENFLSVCECEKIPKCVVDPFKKVCLQNLYTISLFGYRLHYRN